MSAFSPVGDALPRRRDALIEARDASTVTRLEGGGESIIVPEARDRILDLFEREQLPGDVRASLSGSLTGDMRAQQLLFQAMIDTWPRLQKALREVKLAARKAPWQVLPWSERGEDPDESAEKLAKEVESAIWKMKPDMARQLKGFEGTIESLVEGYYLGHQVCEVHWDRKPEGWRPTCTRTLSPRFYGYPYNYGAGEDRLMLDRQGAWATTNFEDFPANRFLIAVNGGHPGHPTVSAPLRALAGYWLAAVYGLKWLLKYSELFGIPMRWAEYADVTDKAQVAAMLRNIGNAGWGVFKSGTKINFVDAVKSGNALPQRELIELADEQVDVFILGQTLTSSAGDAGSRALGEVHMGVRKDLIAGVCDFVGEVLTHQLVPAMVSLNYGNTRDDMPGIWAKWEEEKDMGAMAQRDATIGLLDGTLPVSKAWLYERHGVPMPKDGDDLFQTGANGAQGDPATGASVPRETKPRLEASDGTMIEAGGFRTLEDGTVIYLENPRTASKSDNFADAYRSGPRSRKESENDFIDKYGPTQSGGTKAPSDLWKKSDEEDDELRKARLEYEQSLKEEAMQGFPEIGEEMRGKLPRPDHLDDDEPMKGEVERIWRHFEKETARRRGDGKRVIAPAGAAQFFAPKGQRVKLDDLRQRLNSKGFEFSTVGDMLNATFESLEGRKSWGTMSDGFGVAAKDATHNAAAILKRFEKLKADKVPTEDELANLLAAAWLSGAKETDGN